MRKFLKSLGKNFTLLLIGALFFTTASATTRYKLSPKNVIYEGVQINQNGTTTGSQYLCINCSGQNFISDLRNGYNGSYYSITGVSTITVLWTSVSTGTTGGSSDTLLMSQKAISGYMNSAISGFLLTSASGTYFNANSGSYFNANSGTYFKANSGVYFETNSGKYYTANPLGFITGSSLNGYLTGSALSGYVTGQLYNSLTSGYIPYFSGNNRFLNSQFFLSGLFMFSNQPLRFAGSGLAWNDIQNTYYYASLTAAFIPQQLVISGSTVRINCFTGMTNTGEIFGMVEVPHDAYLGTGAIFSPHLHYVVNDKALFTGVISLEYTIMKNGSLPLTPIVLTLRAYNKTGWMSYAEDFNADIVATGLNIGDTIAWRLYRDPLIATDTYTGNICLLGLGMHYQIDSNGSRQEYVK